MKNILLSLLIVISVFAETEKEVNFNIYGIDAAVNTGHSSSRGLGVSVDSEEFKAKVETTSDFTKLSTVLKVNPLHEDVYHKLGLSYVNQKLYAPDESSQRLNQESIAFATGYMWSETLYLEGGYSTTQLHGADIGTDYYVRDEQTDRYYFEAATRLDLAGTVDISGNYGTIIHQYTDNADSYGVGLDYYPAKDIKLGYKFQSRKLYDTAEYYAQYKYFFAKHTYNSTLGTYQTNIGVSFRFGETIQAPDNIIPHLSELHRFEEIAFGDNMNIQTTHGIEKKPEQVPGINAAFSGIAIELATTQPTNYDTSDHLTGMDNPVFSIGAVTSSTLDAGQLSDFTSRLSINSATGVLIMQEGAWFSIDYSVKVTVNATQSGVTESAVFEPWYNGAPAVALGYNNVTVWELPLEEENQVHTYNPPSYTTNVLPGAVYTIAVFAADFVTDVTIDPVTGVWSVTPTRSDGGADMRVTVTNPDGSTATADFWIEYTTG